MQSADNLSKSTTFIILALSFILVCCKNKVEDKDRFEHIDSLMKLAPETAYDSLCNILTNDNKFNKKELMSCRLKKAMMQGTLNKGLPSTSVFQEVADYYEANGTANEHIQSLYLLGCIYRDEGKVPLAAECFRKAVEDAGQTDEEYDYVTLYKVCDQIVDLYSMQHLYDKAIAADRQCINYASTSGNDSLRMLGESRLINLFDMAGKTDSVIAQTRRCADLYEQHGANKKAAGMYLPMISVLMENGEYGKAAHYIHEFETISGLVDNKGDVSEPYEKYYGLKGLYCLHTGALDSAKLFYEKMRETGDAHTAAHGLLNVYAASRNTERGMELAAECQREMDSVVKENQTKVIELSAALHSLEEAKRDLETSQQNEEHTQMALLIAALAAILAVSSGAITISLYRKRCKMKDLELTNKSHECDKIARKYNVAQNELDEKRMMISDMHEQSKAAIDQLQQDKAYLEFKVRSYEEKLITAASSESDIQFEEDDVYKYFKNKCLPASISASIPHKDWKRLSALMHKCNHKLWMQLNDRCILSEMESRVGMLVFLGFNNSEIVGLMSGTSPSSVSNTKKKINIKLYNTPSASSLRANMLRGCA